MFARGTKRDPRFFHTVFPRYEIKKDNMRTTYLCLFLGLVSLLGPTQGLKSVKVADDPKVKAGSRILLECKARSVKKKLTKCAWYNPHRVK